MVARYEKCLAGTATPREAIRAMCLQCVGGVRKDVLDCSDRSCPLWKTRERLFKPRRKASPSADAPGEAPFGARI